MGIKKYTYLHTMHIAHMAMIHKHTATNTYIHRYVGTNIGHTVATLRMSISEFHSTYDEKEKNKIQFQKNNQK